MMTFLVYIVVTLPCLLTDLRMDVRMSQCSIRRAVGRRDVTVGAYFKFKVMVWMVMWTAALRHMAELI